MKFFIAPLVYLMVLMCMDIHAQDFCLGARARGLANAGIADSSSWSLFNNPAGISRISAYRLMISDEYLYGINQIRSLSAGIIIPAKHSFVLGIHANKQGYQWFNDQQLGIHVAHAIRIYNLSASLILWQRIAGEHLREINPMLNIGGTMSVNKSLQLGLHIFNISNTKHIPMEIKAGMLYKISRQILFYGDLVKQNIQPVNLRMGLEYHIHTYVYLRSGVMLKPMRLNGGIGFATKKISIDYSISYQYPLGYRHQISLLIGINKKK
jgi:hypothetical protein